MTYWLASPREVNLKLSAPELAISSGVWLRSKDTHIWQQWIRLPPLAAL